MRDDTWVRVVSREGGGLLIRIERWMGDVGCGCR